MSACALPARVGLCKMASGPSRTAAEEYRPNRYVSLPAELDPATYDTPLEKRRAEAERLAIRARLKRQYLLQLNTPKPPRVIVSGAGGAGGGLWASPPHTDGSGPRQSLSPSRGLAGGAVPTGSRWRGAAWGGICWASEPMLWASRFSCYLRKILPCSAGTMPGRTTCTPLSARHPRRPS
nr:hypothetical protein walter [Gallus gallus]